jgi:hypothetical protein
MCMHVPECARICVWVCAHAFVYMSPCVCARLSTCVGVAISYTRLIVSSRSKASSNGEKNTHENATHHMKRKHTGHNDVFSYSHSSRQIFQSRAKIRATAPTAVGVPSASIDRANLSLKSVHPFAFESAVVLTTWRRTLRLGVWL